MVLRLTPDDGAPTIRTVRALSQETVELVDQLHRTTRAEAAVALLARIAGAGEPLAAPRIMSLVLDDRPAVAAAAEQAVVALRRRVGLRALGAFDRAFRHRSAFRTEELRWHRLPSEQVRSLAARSHGPTLVQLATCHPSGHVREEAIRCCAVHADGSEVPFLLLRANDWVLPVAERARSALRARLGAGHLADLVAALPMLDEMHRWGRLGSPSILDDVEAARGVGPSGRCWAVGAEWGFGANSPLASQSVISGSQTRLRDGKPRSSIDRSHRPRATAGVELHRLPSMSHGATAGASGQRCRCAVADLVPTPRLRSSYVASSWRSARS